MHSNLQKACPRQVCNVGNEIEDGKSKFSFDMNFEPAGNSINILNAVLNFEPTRYSKHKNEFRVEFQDERRVV